MIAAVDIGGTKIGLGLINDEGEIVAQSQIPTRADGPYSAALASIVEALDNLRSDTGNTISGIGIGCTGPVDPITGVLGEVNFFPHWKGAPLVEDLERAFSVRAAMENDADAAALGEAGWGAGQGVSRLVYITVGTGIGAGVIVDGTVYRGANGAHPEIGHHLLDPSGPACSCGLNGCWESWAAGPGFADWLRRHAPEDYPHRNVLTAERICSLAAHGDEWALRAVKHEALYLGLGLVNVINIFLPQLILLGGSVMKSLPLYIDDIQRTIKSSCGMVPLDGTHIAAASLGHDANLIGAARVWYERIGKAGVGVH